MSKPLIEPPDIAADAAALLASVPLASFLGMRLGLGGEDFVAVMPFNEEHLGNVRYRRMHGGAIAGFLECVASLYLNWQAGQGGRSRTISFGIDYLRPGAEQDTFAVVRPVSFGARVARLRLEAWQTDISRPIAIAHASFDVAPRLPT